MLTDRRHRHKTPMRKGKPECDTCEIIRWAKNIHQKLIYLQLMFRDIYPTAVNEVDDRPEIGVANIRWENYGGVFAWILQQNFLEVTRAC